MKCTYFRSQYDKKGKESKTKLNKTNKQTNKEIEIPKKLITCLEVRRIISICNTYAVDLGKLHLFCIFTLVDHVNLTNHFILSYTN